MLDPTSAPLQFTNLEEHQMGLHQPLMAALVPDDSMLRFELPEIFFKKQNESFLSGIKAAI